MKIEDFINKPFAKDCKEYEHSFLDLSPKPEYATGEVVLASTYRKIGFSDSGISEKKVYTNGTELERNLRRQRDPMEMIMGSMLVLSFGILSFMKLLRA